MWIMEIIIHVGQSPFEMEFAYINESLSWFRLGLSLDLTIGFQVHQHHNQHWSVTALQPVLVVVVVADGVDHQRKFWYRWRPWQTPTESVTDQQHRHHSGLNQRLYQRRSRRQAAGFRVRTWTSAAAAVKQPAFGGLGASRRQPVASECVVHQGREMKVSMTTMKDEESMLMRKRTMTTTNNSTAVSPNTAPDASLTGQVPLVKGRRRRQVCRVRPRRHRHHHRRLDRAGTLGWRTDRLLHDQRPGLCVQTIIYEFINVRLICVFTAIEL